MKTKIIRYVSENGAWMGDCDACSPLPKKNDSENINLINYIVIRTKKTGDTLYVTLRMKDNLSRFNCIKMELIGK